MVVGDSPNLQAVPAQPNIRPGTPGTPGGAGARTGAVAVSQTTRTTRRTDGSSENMARTVESHWQALTRREHIQVAAGLQAATANGRHLTYDEFVRITGYDVLTREAWRAMVGGEDVASLEDLDYYLTVFDNWSRLSGVSFDEFSRSKRITVVHDAELLSHMLSMSADSLRNLVRSLGRTQLENFLQQAIPGMPGLPTNLVGMAPARVEDMLVRALQRLQSTAMHGSPLGQPQARHVLSLIGSAALHRLGRYAEHDGFSRGLGDPGFHLNGNNYDPLVARHLLAGWVGAQADGTAVTTELANFASRVQVLRHRVEQINLGRRSIAERLNIDNLDSNSENFAPLLSLAERRSNDSALSAAVTSAPSVQSLHLATGNGEAPLDINTDGEVVVIPGPPSGTATAPAPVPTGTIANANSAQVIHVPVTNQPVTAATTVATASVAPQGHTVDAGVR